MTLQQKSTIHQRLTRKPPAKWSIHEITERHFPRPTGKQAVQYRELDKQVAIAIGYKVECVPHSQIYVLVRPHSSTPVPLGGLYTITGRGPTFRLTGPFMGFSGRTAEDAWEWVPHFTTEPIHYSALIDHVQMELNIVLSTPIESPVHVCEDIIDQMIAR